MKHFIFLLLLVFTVNSHAQQTKTTVNDTPTKQKAILITGASSGIGRKIAETLANKGYFVYAGARKKKDIDALSAIENIEGIKLDVTIQEDIDNAATYVSKQDRGLYGLVNNAGVTVFGPLIEVSEADMQFQMDVNLFGPYRVTKAFAPLIMQSKGRIVTTGSIAGIFAGGMVGPYNMSKFAIEGFTEALASEMKKFGVGVSVVEPGNYNSNIIKNMKKRGGSISDDSLFKEDMQQLFQYFTEDRSNHKDPDEVAAAVEHALFSEQPKLRYMVVPNQQQAQLTIRKAIEKVIQLNEQQPYTYDRKTLIEMLDKAIAKSNKT